MTGRYLVLDIDRIRVHMCRITDEFVKLLGINDSDMRPWKPAKEVSFDPAEFTQLRISLMLPDSMQPGNALVMTDNLTNSKVSIS